ncbi:MAG: isoprenylcysteine carboxylmethyltransferase family protein [Candidatus Rokubacteria bacterium]|nr:isoprenylcysteine carboxylmethyltransferase family protein [Candidatus Rokubacteria bacterium]
MSTEIESRSATVGQLAAKGTIVLAFVVALEVLIMISPFALFFYAVFNPVLLVLGTTPFTRWLTAFFLPHMVVPPNAGLAAIRVLGSVFFVLGLLGFLACAIQVYAGKIRKTGVASKGGYALVRHPQYLSLAVSGIGLAILWPRFLSLVLLAVMLFLYYVLAKDEERRMLGRHGKSYRDYLGRTGMFLPRLAEARLLPEEDAPLYRVSAGKALGILAVLLVVLVSTGFVLRSYTIRHLPLAALDGVDAIAITAEDLAAARDLLPKILEDGAVATRTRAGEHEGHRLLAYVIPVDYTMQGMIADTGPEWRLFDQHKTVAMITDYVLHPFAHLTEGHAHATPAHGSVALHDSPAMRRRIIFLDVVAEPGRLMSASDDFAINVRREPRVFADVHLHTGEVLKVVDIPSGSGWGRVPTPSF